MSFLISIYEQRLPGRQVSWTTLGLGEATIDERGGTLPVVKERVLRALKTWVRKAKARALIRLEQLPGITLERHRVTLDAAGVTLTLSIPLVVEPRHTGVGPPVLVGYHPLRQDDFFFVDPERPRPAQYRLFLEHLLRKVDDEDTVRDLETRKDRLRTLIFDAEIPSLLERVGPAKTAWWKDLQPKNEGEPDDAPASELDTIATDLSERASERVLELGLARKSLDTRLATLAERGPVVLVGPPGVGKTTLIHRWVSERLEADGYRIHRSLERVRRVWALAGRRILAGMKHHGDWEARVARLYDELVRRRGFLVVPDLVAWSTLGRTRDSERSLADVWRGPLERREITIIGEATPAAWARLEEDAPAFASQFKVLEVMAPHPDDVLRMLLAAGRTMEDTGSVVFDAETYDAVAEWSEVLDPGRSEPGRSLTLLKEASQQDEQISESDLISTVTERAGVPENLLQHTAQVAGFQPGAALALRHHIVGQSEATDAALALLDRIRTGLTDPQRPWAVFLLTGPTGTGKTELAKGIAQHLYDSPRRLVRIDMNQLTGPDAVARLIGDAFAPDGLLTAPILESPFQVVLLDELEKAHPSALYILLQLLDEGRLTDAAGRTADFRRAVILITSNLGASRPPLGFGDGPDAVTRRADTTRAVAAALPPELFNRLDAVLAFQPLTADIARQIAGRQVALVGARAGLTDRHSSLSVSDAALDVVVRNGFDPEYGARTVKRWVESHIVDSIAEKLVALPGDRLKRVVVDAREDALDLRVEMLASARRTHVLPYAHLLVGAIADAEPVMDEMIRRLAAISAEPVRDRDGEDERRLVPHDDPEVADRLYWREQLQAAVAASLKTLRRMRSMRRSGVHEIVQELSHAAFVARVAAVVDEPIHRITIALTRPSQTRLDVLLPALIEAYRRPPWEVEDSAFRRSDGVITTDRKAVGNTAVVMTLSGLGVALAMLGELGSHVLDVMTEGLEVVAVTAVPGARPAREALADLDPRHMPDEIRHIRYETRQSKEALPYVLDDLRTGHHERGHLADLPTLTAWCLALSKSAEAL